MYQGEYKNIEIYKFKEMEKVMKAYNILWDVDDEGDNSREEILKTLPTEMEIPEGIDEEDVADYLSDETGFCHFGFALEK